MDQIYKLNITQNEKIVVLDLVNKLIEVNEVEAVLFVGSVVKGVYNKNKSGIDLIVLIKEDSMDSMIIREINKKGLEFYKSDDIYILNNMLISIHIQKYQFYIQYLESIITSEATEVVQKDWVIGGVYKEVILDDIANAIIVYDQIGSITELSHRLKNKYQLGKKFGNSLISQLKNKLILTKNQYDEGNMILFHIGFWECIELTERLYCHEHKIYNRGFKHVLKQKEFLERFDLVNFDYDSVQTLKMNYILEKIYVEYGVSK